jgi:hypothetical protein
LTRVHQCDCLENRFSFEISDAARPMVVNFHLHLHLYFSLIHGTDVERNSLPLPQRR